MMKRYSNYKEYLNHPLFKISRRHAMSKAAGTCSCGNPATEVHHADGYPAWNAFDCPSKLTPICHECHCKEHEEKL